MNEQTIENGLLNQKEEIKKNVQEAMEAALEKMKEYGWSGAALTDKGYIVTEIIKNPVIQERYATFFQRLKYYFDNFKNPPFPIVINENLLRDLIIIDSYNKTKELIKHKIPQEWQNSDYWKILQALNYNYQNNPTKNPFNRLILTESWQEFNFLMDEKNYTKNHLKKDPKFNPNWEKAHLIEPRVIDPKFSVNEPLTPHQAFLLLAVK
jgi:hypothetical protein